jgi:GxxExxY protein
MTKNAIAREIVDAAFRIHTTLGPGLLESVYAAVLVHELARRGLRTVLQYPIPVNYQDIRIEIGSGLIWWLKTRSSLKSNLSSRLPPFTRSSFVTYLRLADKRLGLLINFNVVLIKDGITRVVNGLEDEPNHCSI